MFDIIPKNLVMHKKIAKFDIRVSTPREYAEHDFAAIFTKI